MHLSSMRVIAFASLAALSLAACGGGISTPPASRMTEPPSATATPTATATTTLPTPAAGSATSSIALGTSPVTTNIAALSGISTSISFPAQTQAASVAVVTTTGSATSGQSKGRHAFIASVLPQGPYYITTSFTPDRTIDAGAGNVTYDIAQLLSTTSAGSSLSGQLALIAAYLSTPGAPQPYVGLLDPSGNFSVIGPIQFNGTTLGANLPAGLKIAAGTTYQVGLHFGPLTPIVVATASPTASPTASASASASPAPTPTGTPIPVPTATPTVAPTATPTASPAPTPTSSPTPHTLTQTIDAGGHSDTDSNAFLFETVGPYSASIGYPTNNSNVVSATTTAYSGLAPNAPAPSSGTVVYSVSTSLSGGPPNNQTSITFATANNATVSGILDVPANVSGTYSIYAYVPAYYGNTPIYSATGLTPVNGQLTFSSPFSAGSSVTLPTNTTIYFELTH